MAIVGECGTFAIEALAWMLKQNGSRVLGVYRNARALRIDLEPASADVEVVFVDAEDPGSGACALADVRRAAPRLKIMLLCEALTPLIVRGAIEARVEGVVLKSDSVEQLMSAYRHVLDGRAVMPCGWQEVPMGPEDVDPVESLSVREREVMELAAGGMRNREIAERLMISPNTVKFHLRTIYSRLGVRNRVQAARVAASALARPTQDIASVGSNTSGEGDHRN